MSVVNITELKNNLSHYLRQVRKGNEVIIKDRNRVIARIVPAAPEINDEEELLELAAQGKIRLADHLLMNLGVSAAQGEENSNSCYHVC